MRYKNFGIIIQARTSSTRLPGKIILEIEDRVTFLDVLLNRLNFLNIDIPIFLATSNLIVDSVLEVFAIKNNIKFYTGSEQNVLQRFINCAEENSLDTIIRICSDNPFIDLKSIENMCLKYKGEDYLSYKINEFPSILTHFGFFAEIVSLKALKKVAQKNDNKCQEHVTNCIYNSPNEYNICFLGKEIKNKEIRCTLDTKEDFDILKDLYINFIKKNPKAGYLEIIKYIETRPELLLLMKKNIKENIKENKK